MQKRMPGSHPSPPNPGLGLGARQDPGLLIKHSELRFLQGTAAGDTFPGGRSVSPCSRSQQKPSIQAVEWQPLPASTGCPSSLKAIPSCKASFRCSTMINSVALFLLCEMPFHAVPSLKGLCRLYGSVRKCGEMATRLFMSPIVR